MILQKQLLREGFSLLACWQYLLYVYMHFKSLTGTRRVTSCLMSEWNHTSHFLGLTAIHPFFKLLVLCWVTGMLEPLPASQAVGRKTLWTDGRSITWHTLTYRQFSFQVTYAACFWLRENQSTQKNLTETWEEHANSTQRGLLSWGSNWGPCETQY